jgi:hypothetical protein
MKKTTGLEKAHAKALNPFAVNEFFEMLTEVMKLERPRSSKLEKRMGKGPLKKEVDKSMPQVLKSELTWYLRY